MDFLSQLLRGIAFVPALVSGIEGLFGSKPGAEKEKRCDVISRKCVGHDRRGGCTGNHQSRKVQEWHFQNNRRHGGMPERLDLVQGSAS